MSVETIFYLTTIRFGEGASKSLPDELAALKISKPLVVSDEGLAKLGVVDRVIAPLGEKILFDQTPSNPTEAAARSAVALYLEHGCDGVVALGGGSPIDLAKAVSLLVSHEGKLASFAAIEGGLSRITDRCAPVVAIPTTAGTGAEVGRAALITVEDGRKLGLISPNLIPKLAICDPELTHNLPPILTAATGMDAITHCFETFLSPKDNPVAEAIALDGLQRGWQNIEAAVQSGMPEARRQMMMSSLQGGLTFQKGLGGVHSLSHPLGALKSVNPHHGMLNAVLLPHLLDFNAQAVPEKFARLSVALGTASGLADAVRDLNNRIGMPTRLSEMGLNEDHLKGIAALAVADHSTPTNARPISEDDFDVILQSAL